MQVATCQMASIIKHPTCLFATDSLKLTPQVAMRESPLPFVKVFHGPLAQIGKGDNLDNRRDTFGG